MKQYILFTVLFLFSSCTSFLEEDMVSTISYQYYNTEAGIEDALKSAYQNLRTYNGSDVGTDLQILGTDEYTTAADGNTSLNAYTSGINPRHGMLNTLWTEHYRGISICNIVINRVMDVKGTSFLTTEKNRQMRMAEARFLRAYYYFVLVQTFGKVPLLTAENLTIQTEFKRASVESIYQQIITDLRFAVDYLYEKTNLNDNNNLGRATRGAALHYLAKVYLTRGSAVTDVRGQKPTDIDSAAYYSEELIRSNKYALQKDYADVFDFQKQNSPEVIFTAQYSADKLLNNPGNKLHLYFLMPYDVKPGMMRDLQNGRPWKRFRPTDYTIDVYDKKVDSRFYKSYTTVYYCNNEKNIPKDENGNPKFSLGDTAIYLMPYQATDSYIKSKRYLLVPRNKFTLTEFLSLNKYLDPYRENTSTENGSRDFIMARLAETYLIAAEACGRKGDYAKAAGYLNVIRQRAAYKEGEVKPSEYYLYEDGKFEDLAKSTEEEIRISAKDINSFDSMLTFVLEERTRELNGECWRWFDLTRTELLHKRTKLYNKEALNIMPYHRLRPIPQDHIDRLSAIGDISEEQNEGYY